MIVKIRVLCSQIEEHHCIACMHVVTPSSLVLIRREGHMLETTVAEMLQFFSTSGRSGERAYRLTTHYKR